MPGQLEHRDFENQLPVDRLMLRNPEPLLLQYVRTTHTFRKG